MCGISVYYAPDSSAAHRADAIATMNAEMVYRGPDGVGTHSDGPMTMGMRRLSIIDLEGGAQPLFNEDRTISLVCNGEIYNHVELRAVLTGKGHHFATGSDSETILHLYEEYGERGVEYLRGMFAFALWDSRRQRLVVARDRLGIKPLYVTRRGRSIAFSSEMKALVRAGLASSEVDHSALYQTLRHTYPVSERRTPARDVDRVPPGTILIVDETGVHERRYWTPQFAGGHSSASDDEISATLTEAVQLHLRSDVPVAVLLSAGIDSAAISAIAARSRQDVVALSAGYSGQHDCDERAGAQATARALGIRCLEVELDATDFPVLFNELVGYCDEPPGDIASIAQWAMYRACRDRGYKVVLSGIGGDEIFFGYPAWNRAGESLGRRPRFERHLPHTVAEAYRHVGRIAPRLRAHLGAAWPGPWTGLGASAVVTSCERVLRWLGADPRGRESETADDIVLEFESHSSPGPDAMYSFLVGAYLPNNGFQLADKLGMGNSVEVRVPFADHVLFERVVGLPLSRRYAIGQAKPLLKRVLRSHLPQEVLQRPKQGFAPPTAFLRDIVREHAEAILSSEDLRVWLRHDRLARFLDAYLSTSVPSRAGRIAFGGLAPQHANWVLYGLAAFVKSRETWT